MSEKLCLNWNDFQDNVISAFGNLRDDQDFADVTLVCEDGHKIEAHKVILVTSSPFLEKLLKLNKHPHPLIYMRGMKSEDLSAIIDFLYSGSANVYQENLESFLSIAEEFQLKGLRRQDNSSKDKKFDELGSQPINSRNNGAEQNGQLKSKFEVTPANSTKFSFKDEVPISKFDDQRIMMPTNYYATDLGELDEKVKSMMEKGHNTLPNRAGKVDVCKICGKEGQWVAIRDHIEANHLEGISLPCNICGKIFRSRLQLRKHRCVNDAQK